MLKNTSLIVYVSALILAGCGRVDNDLSLETGFQKSDDVIQQGRQTRPIATTPKLSSAKSVLTPSQKLVAPPDYIFSVDPAEFKTIPFSKFAFKNENGAAEDNLSNSFETGSAVISATGLPGNLSDGDVEARITARELVVVGPVIPRSDNDFRTQQLLTLTGRDNQQVTVLIQTRAPDIGARVDDEFHFESDPKLPLVNVKGLSSSGVLGGSDFILSLDSGGPIKTNRTHAYSLGNNGQVIITENISDYIQLDSIAPSLSVERSALQEILRKIPMGAATLQFELQQQNDVNHVSVDFFNGNTVLKGQLIDGYGDPFWPDISQTGELEILMKGVNSNYRRIITVDPDGTFVVDDLPAGETYFLTVSDLRFPNLFSHFAAVYSNSTEVDVALYYAPVDSAPKQGVSSRTTQNGHTLSRPRKK